VTTQKGIRDMDNFAFREHLPRVRIKLLFVFVTATLSAGFITPAKADDNLDPVSVTSGACKTGVPIFTSGTFTGVCINDFGPTPSPGPGPDPGSTPPDSGGGTTSPYTVVESDSDHDCSSPESARLETAQQIAASMTWPPALGNILNVTLGSGNNTDSYEVDVLNGGKIAVTLFKTTCGKA